MTAKEYLKRREDLEYSIRVNSAKAKKYEAQALNRTPRLSKDAGLKPTKDAHFMETMIAEKLDCEANVKNATAELIKLNSEFRAGLKNLSKSKYRAVIELRYIEKMPWDGVAQAVGYSARQSQRFLKEAVAELEKLSRDVA